MPMPKNRHEMEINQHIPSVGLSTIVIN